MEGTNIESSYEEAGGQVEEVANDESPDVVDADVILEEKEIETLADRIGLLKYLPQRLRKFVWFPLLFVFSFLLAGPLMLASVIILKPKAISICQKYKQLVLEGRVVERRIQKMKVKSTGREIKLHRVVLEYTYPPDPSSSDTTPPSSFRKKLSVKPDQFSEWYPGKTVELECLPGRPKSAITKGGFTFVEERCLSGNVCYQIFQGLSMSFFVSLIIGPHVSDKWWIILTLVQAVVLLAVLVIVWWMVPNEDRLIEIGKLEHLFLEDPEDQQSMRDGMEDGNMLSTPLLSAAVFA